MEKPGEGHESETEEIEVEVEADAGAGTTTGAAGSGDGYDFDFDIGSISLHGYAEDEEMKEEEESGTNIEVETDYGSVEMVNEDETVYEQLEQTEYNNYRFIMLGEARGIEHHIVKKLAYLRSLPGQGTYGWQFKRCLLSTRQCNLVKSRQAKERSGS